LAAITMMLSGWRIYDASPIYRSIEIPISITLGGWLGGAPQWHFAAMWLLVASGAVYLMLGLTTGRLRRRSWPISPAAVFAILSRPSRESCRMLI
jgi:thiosulfate reductase cytochrome b subunit